MLMRPDDRVERGDAGVEQLLAQVRRGVDDDVGAPLLHQDRHAAAPVAWLGGIAIAPIIADAGNSSGGAAAEYTKLHRALG
jgi:hypothetical protein